MTGVLGLFLGARVHDWDASSIVSYLQEAAHGSPPEEAPAGPTHSFQRTVSGSRELEEGPGPVAEQSEVGGRRRPPG